MKALYKRKVLTGIAASLMLTALLIVLGSSRSKRGAPPASAPEVEVVQVERRDVPIYSEWIGTLDGMVNAEIKAQVAGYLLSKNYTEGSFVKKGQLLFEIDPRPFQAALDQARGDLAKAEGQLAQASGQLSQSQAQLAEAEASQGKTQLDQNRYTTLVEQGVISREQYDNAVQANLGTKAQVKAGKAGVETSTASITSARAAVEAAKAAVQTAELNLSFTKIISPIDGIAGISVAQVGNLIQPINPNSGALTTVSAVDPVKVYFTLSEPEYLTLIKRNPTQAELNAANQRMQLELVLVDGTTYPHKGKFYLADREVDQKTGAIRLAAVFPNPGNLLRPGQYGRIRATINTKQAALLVPQRAVSELQGIYQVAVVDADNRVSIRPVKTGERVDTMWIIESGLNPGESVVAEGTQRVRPGAAVVQKPFVAAR